MGDNLTRIESWTFYNCEALRRVRLSKRLECIGRNAFNGCESLNVLFIPPTSTVREIQNVSFVRCTSLKVLVLPPDIDLEQNEGYYIASLCPSLLPNTHIQYSVSASHFPIHQWL